MSADKLRNEPVADASVPVHHITLFRRIADFVLGVVEACTCLAVLATCAGFAAAWWWRFDIASHFRPQYLVALMVTCVVLGISGRWWWTAIAAVGIAVNAAVLTPYYFGRQTAAPEAPRLRLLLYHAPVSSDRFEEARGLVRHHTPDVAVFVEVDGRWNQELRKLADDYPHRASNLSGEMGLTVLSRIPFEEADFLPLTQGCQAARLRLRIGSQPVTLIGVHAFPPHNNEQAEARNEQLRGVAKLTGEEQHPVVVLGDFNTPSWSAIFSIFRQCGLRDSRFGWGLQASWPRRLGPLGMAFDQCVTSPEVRVVDRQVVPAIGSDRLPLLVELALPP